MIEPPFRFFGFAAGDQDDLITKITHIDLETQLMQEDIFQGFVAAFLVLKKDTAEDAFVFEKGLDLQVFDRNDLAMDLQSFPAMTAQLVFLEQEIHQSDLIDLPVAIDTVHRWLFAFLRYAIVSSILSLK